MLRQSPWTRREGLWAWCAALLVALVIVGRPVWDGERLACATDLASAQAPWNQAVEPRSPQDLSDQGLALYPAWRWTATRLAAGELPLWNDQLFLGVPWLANPQWGVLDPQGLALALSMKLGGPELFDRAFAWLAVLRLTLALVGSYFLARRLRLEPGPAAFAALAAVLSGASILWAGSSVGRVLPFLPWMLLGVERLRAPGTRREQAGLAGGIGAATALALLGGHPETAAFCGLAAGAWALSFLRANAVGAAWALGGLALGALAAAAALVPFLEYLAHSGAWLAHRLALRAPVDFALLAALLVACGALWQWKVIEGRASAASERGRTAGLVGVLLGCTALLALCCARSGATPLRLALLPDLHGDPTRGTWGAAGTFVEQAGTWLALPVWGLALALVFQARGTSPAARLPRVVTLGALVASLVALRLAGVGELWQALPLVGTAAPARAAPVACLFVALCAGWALQHAVPRARRSAAVLVALAVGCALWIEPPRAAQAPNSALDPDDELVGWLTRPSGELAPGGERHAFWLHPALSAEPRLVLSHGARGEQHSLLPERLAQAPVAGAAPGASAGSAPADAHWYRTPLLDARALSPGRWQLRVVLLDPEGGLLGERLVAELELRAERALGGASLAALAATLAALILLPPRARFGTLAWILLLALQAAAFARGWFVSVPRAASFPFTQTEALLTREQGPERVLGARGVLSENTALVHGVRTLAGYDALDPLSFDLARGYALLPGAHPIVDWNAGAIDFDAPLARLFGLGWLAGSFRTPPPGFELAAGPDAAPGRRTEVELWRAVERPPRAFLVREIVAREAVLADLASWRPFEQAFLDDDVAWRPARPFREGVIELVQWSGEEVSVDLRLDGDGLFVLTDQAFPGWQAEVDGVATPVLTVDGLFRGVPLSAGPHRVELRYRPQSLRIGAWISLAALLGLASCAALGLRWRRRAAALAT